eukprot:365195-Chlamydomonas_euryale.AAC.11
MAADAAEPLAPPTLAMRAINPGDARHRPWQHAQLILAKCAVGPGDVRTPGQLVHAAPHQAVRPVAGPAPVVRLGWVMPRVQLLTGNGQQRGHRLTDDVQIVVRQQRHQRAAWATTGKHSAPWAGRNA